jgi:GT2 family glycosyltransferase
MTSAYAYTVALCTHNHADRLVRTLGDLSALALPGAPWELVIIDNASKDETPELLGRHQWPAGWSVRVIREEKLGLSNARNRAIQEACGEYLIFIDDDETPDTDWLCAYERLIEDKQPDAFGGRISVLFEDARPAWLQDNLLGFLGELNRFDSITPLTAPSTSFYGGNFGFRKSVIDRVGGFDATLGRKGSDNTGGEEVDFYRRLLSAGYKVWWTPEAVIYHRIQAIKLSRRYFLDLHFCQGRMEGCRQRGTASRVPPFYLVPQLWRAIHAAVERRLQQGSDHSLRLDMNVVYFMGLILSWAFGKR